MPNPFVEAAVEREAQKAEVAGHARPAGASRVVDARLRGMSGLYGRNDEGSSGEPPGTRTPNPQIKSLLLYQLS